MVPNCLAWSVFLECIQTSHLGTKLIVVTFSQAVEMAAATPAVVALLLCPLPAPGQQVTGSLTWRGPERKAATHLLFFLIFLSLSLHSPSFFSFLLLFVNFPPFLPTYLIYSSIQSQLNVGRSICKHKTGLCFLEAHSPVKTDKQSPHNEVLPRA